MPRVRWCATAVLLLAAMPVGVPAQALAQRPAGKGRLPDRCCFCVERQSAVGPFCGRFHAGEAGDRQRAGRSRAVPGLRRQHVRSFPNSYITFRKNPGSWRDLIDVMVGRVRVHIQRWGNQPNPNKIYTPTAVISVRGTTFEVVVREEDESTIVQVEEGQVAVQHALLPRGNPKVLNTGESITVYKNEPLEARMIDKGSVARYVLRALMDALGTSMSSGGGSIPRAPGGVPGGGGGTIGDTQRPDPPPPPPPPPPQ
jgi:hypothetical protein